MPKIPANTYAFDKALTQDLARLSGPAPRGLRKWSVHHGAHFVFVVAIVGALLILVPNRFFNPALLHITIVMGTLGIWRFGWWFTHAVRAEIYRYFKWPPIRAKAAALWKAGWRPTRVHIQMTTFFEEPAITKRVIGSIIGQVVREGIPTTLWIGTGTPFDEKIIRDFLETYGSSIPDDLLEVTFIRQNQPGKRMAIGLILRAIARYGINAETDLVIFMDGDALYGNDVMEKCLSMFGADPELQALTTDEEVLCYGPEWIQSWLSMRFAQRRLAMSSHSMSNRVLTLTGRMSVFRAKNVVDGKFIRNIEADHLDHWLWGRFRFLSGDDKSTWYNLLSKGCKMLYVPDACVYTIEVVEGGGTKRMVENFRRWSGNMLRNGSRAIALGPSQMPFFIWWCLIDQRLAMWTMMVSPVLAVLAGFTDPLYLWSVLIWVVASRIVLCLFLFRYAREADMSWPFILYFNQIINASVKIFMIFHLSKQKWANRGGQSAGGGQVLQGWIAKFQLATTVVGFVGGLAAYMGLIEISVF